MHCPRQINSKKNRISIQIFAGKFSLKKSDERRTVMIHKRLPFSATADHQCPIYNIAVIDDLILVMQFSDIVDQCITRYNKAYLAIEQPSKGNDMQPTSK
jgi:hypothetical protein